MKSANNMRAIVLFSIVVVAMSFGILTASAGPLGGGDSFANATPIYSGHSSEAWLDVGDEDYFYIMVNAGQTLYLEGSIVTNKAGLVRHSIHDEDKSPLNDGCVNGKFVSDTIRWSPDSRKDSYKFYIRVECVFDGQYNLNVSIEDHYDANSGTDAGNTFDTAMNITQGSYDGFLSGKYHGDQGTDLKDLYKLPLEAGETINVKSTPPDDVKLKTMIYNEDRANVNSTESPDTGAITRSAWTAPSAQDVYILIERAGDYPSGTYHMDISVESPAEHNLSITSFETPSTAVQGNILKTNVSITKTTSFEAWYTVVVSGVNNAGYPLAGTGLVKLGHDSVTVPVWISIPPGAETGNYSLYADVYDTDWNKIADTGPEAVTVTA